MIQSVILLFLIGQKAVWGSLFDWKPRNQSCEAFGYHQMQVTSDPTHSEWSQILISK